METLARSKRGSGEKDLKSFGWWVLCCLVLWFVVPKICFSAELVMVSRAQPGSSSVMGSSFAGAPQLSRNGRFLLFTSQAGNTTLLLPGQHAFGYYLNLYVQDLFSGETHMVSVNKTGTSGGNGHSTCGSISSDGRYIAFESDASDLFDNDQNQASDVFVRDLQSGITRLVSVNQSGTGPGDRDSRAPVITPDGRFVAFESSATDLVSGDTNGIPDLFVRDLQTSTTILISAGSIGVTGNASGTASISDDGRFVVFLSSAGNPSIDAPTGQQQVFARDVAQGFTHQIDLTALQNAAQALGTNVSLSAGIGNPTLSANGTYLAFKGMADLSSIFLYDLQQNLAYLVATNAVSSGPVSTDGTGPTLSSNGEKILFAARPVPTNYNNAQIYLWDKATGQSTLVSSTTGGQPSNGNATMAAMTPEGRYVAFVSDASDLRPNTTTQGFQVYLRDLTSNTTHLVSSRADGSPGGSVENSVPAISDDGRYIAFECFDCALSSGDNNRAIDVFVRDMTASAAVPASLAQQSQTSAIGFSAIRPNALSANGHRALFSSFADNLVTGTGGGFSELFAYDLDKDQIALITVNTNGAPSVGSAHDQVLSANGRAAAFLSPATDLVFLQDTNRTDDVFWRDLDSSSTQVISARADGVSTANPTIGSTFVATTPSISANGDLVAFDSTAADLIDPPVTRSGLNVFLRDVAALQTDWISKGLGTSPGYPSGSTRPGIGAEGSLGAFWASGKVGVWNIGAKTNQLLPDWTTPPQSLNPDTSVAIASLKPILAFESVTYPFHRVFWYDLATGLGGNLTVLPDGNGTTNTIRSKPVISADGRYVAFVSNDDRLVAGDNNLSKDIFVSDLQTRALTLVSVNRDGNASGDGPSDNPVISSDGRYIIFQSDASNLVENDTNGTTDIFVRDMTAKTTTLLSANTAGGIGNGPSVHPSISSDGRAVLFQSLASNLGPGDFNQMPDVFLALLDPRPRFGRIEIQGGQVLVEVDGTSNNSMIIQSSIDLRTWIDVQTNVITSGTVQITITGPVSQQQYFRALQLPAARLPVQ